MPSSTRWYRHLSPMIDYWSVPHFLLGTLMAMGVRVFSLPVEWFFFITAMTAVLWEFFEMQIRIRESTINVASDIALPLLAYMVTLWLTSNVSITHDQLVALLLVTIIFYILVSYASWVARFNQDPDFLD